MLVILWVLLLGAALFSWRSLRDLRRAKWIVKEGQYQVPSQEGLESANKEAESMVIRDSFLQYPVKVRSHYGHSIWIWGQVKRGIPASEINEVPSFKKFEI